MSDEKPSNLGQQLPTSEQLQAAIGPELRALAQQALAQKGEEPPSLADILEPASKDPKELEKAAKKEPVVQKTVPLAFPVAKEIFAQATAQAQQAVVPGVAVPAAAPAIAAPAPAPSSPRPAAPAPAAAQPAGAKKKLSAAEQAKRDQPTAKIARQKSSMPTVLLVVTGIIAVGAAGGAVWQAKKMGAATPAQAATPAPTTSSTEGAVKFAVPARPADDPAPPPADTTPPAEVKPADPAPPVTAAAADPTPPKTDPKATDPKTVHHARVVAPPPPTQAPVAAAEPKKPEEKKPAAQPTAAPSVDAILQQQLKSAIP